MKGLASVITVLVLISQCVCPTLQFEMDSIGRVVRGHLGTLYDLRSKIGGSSGAKDLSGTTTAPMSISTFQHRYSSSHKQPDLKKESRGYAFHYTPSETSHPVYSSSIYNNQDLQSRVGKVSESPSNTWKRTEKGGYEKYTNKVPYKSPPSKESTVNSFNIHEVDLEGGNETSEVKTTSLPLVNPTTPKTVITTPGGINMGPLKSFSQGLNSAVTQVLSQKLMNLLDQDVPQGLLNPLRHLVASGSRMVDYWDRRTMARDGKNPGIVEMLGFGLDQLKKFRDGQELRSSDHISNVTPASKALIQGMTIVKALTNRVLGYDTDEVALESRGGEGWGGGGGGWGHHASYGSGWGSGLDPFSLLAALAFGAFLLQLLLTIMSTSARSLDVTDLNTPLMMSDFHVPNFMTSADKIFGTPTVRSRRSVKVGDESAFFSIVDKLDGVVKAYQQISEKPKCSRLYLCRLAVQDALGDESSVLTKLYMFGLGHLSKDKASTEFVQSIQKRVADGEDINCDKIVKECIPRELNK